MYYIKGMCNPISHLLQFQIWNLKSYFSTKTIVCLSTVKSETTSTKFFSSFKF
jgi:hypothetical protein